MVNATRSRADSPTKTCTDPGCESPLRAHGLCQWHYRRARGIKSSYPTYATPCSWCGAITMKPRDVKYAARYCTLTCRDHGTRWSKGLSSCAVPATHLSRSSPVPIDHPSRTPRPRRVPAFHAGYCAECGKGYIIASECVSASSYCSKTCAKRVGKRARRAREAGASGTFTWDEFTKLALSLGNVCAYCNGDGPLEPDHVVPISRHGHNGLTNILPACRRCNGRKSDMTVKAWSARLLRDGHPPLDLGRFKHLTAHVWLADSHAA